MFWLRWVASDGRLAIIFCEFLLISGAKVHNLASLFYFSLISSSLLNLLSYCLLNNASFRLRKLIKPSYLSYLFFLKGFYVDFYWLTWFWDILDS